MSLQRNGLDRSNFTKKWIERAERNGTMLDKADRFIALWIAFNGWMRGKYGEAKSDKKLIAKVKECENIKITFDQLQIEDHSFSDHLAELSEFTIVNMKYIDDPSRETKYDGTFSSLLDTIYQIRCNLFHGRKRTKDEDYQLICLAHDILSPLFKKYLQQYGYD